MSININRVLNLKKIKAIGLDMDHTIVRYDSEKFERLTYQVMIKKLIESKNYPQQIASIPFNFKQAIRGLVIDKQFGNLVKISLYGRVKQAYHGTKMLDYQTMNEYYQGMVIDLNDANFRCIDTTFSISEAVLYSNLVDFKESHPQLIPQTYEQLHMDINEVLDLSHRDGSLKGVVAKNISDYIIQDPEIPQVLEKFKRAGKKLIVITNSDYQYTKLLLDYSFNLFLKEHKHWSELFDLVVTLAEKPSFFMEKRQFLKVHPENAMMTNVQGKLQNGIYQGGSAYILQKDLQLIGEEILYLGDHIFGDILQLKKVCHWRTALVVEEISQEIKSHQAAATINLEIEELMEQKERFEFELNALIEKRDDQDKIYEYQNKIKNIDQSLSLLIEKYQNYFNPFWGEIMRAGQEESRFMGQVAKYACLYMSSVADFKDYTARHYFRPHKRPLPHELEITDQRN